MTRLSTGAKLLITPGARCQKLGIDTLGRDSVPTDAERPRRLLRP